MLSLLRESIVLTNRDRKLFYYLFRNKTALIRQIRRDVFVNCSYQGVHRRLDKLRRHKLIEANYIRELKGALAYSLTKAGFRKLINGEGEMPSLVLKSASRMHDLGLLDLRDRLSQFHQIEKVISENELQSKLFDENKTLREIKELRADGAVIINGKQRKLQFALEYESSLKFFKRYQDFFSKYELSGEIEAVLFITETKEIKQKVMAREKKQNGRSTGKILYLSLDEVPANAQKMVFTNIKGTTFEIS